MTITDFLLARIAEDEALAREAINPEVPGERWHWVTVQTDVAVASGDLAEAQEFQKVSLRTIEEYPTSAGNLPAFAIGYAEDVHPGAGEHIAHHDPARVLAECAAKRAIIGSRQSCAAMTAKEQESGTKLVGAGMVQGLDVAMKSLAAAYSDHPDYQREWTL